MWGPGLAGAHAGRGRGQGGSEVPASRGLPHVALTSPTNLGQRLTREGGPRGHAPCERQGCGWASGPGTGRPGQWRPGLTVPGNIPPLRVGNREPTAECDPLTGSGPKPEGG